VITKTLWFQKVDEFNSNAIEIDVDLPDMLEEAHRQLLQYAAGRQVKRMRRQGYKGTIVQGQYKKKREEDDGERELAAEH
jgi:hypothetical protein